MKKCAKCGLEVKWVMVGKRWFCKNPDESDHWDLCSKYTFDKIKSEGTPYHDKHGKEYSKGYDHKTFGRKSYERGGTWTHGKQYKPIHHKTECQIPPWEDCDCGSY